MVRDVFLWWNVCGPVDRTLDSRSEGLGFDSQCWPSVEVSGKLCITHCLVPPSGNGYLVYRSKVGSIVAGCIGAHLARGKVKSVEHALSWSLDAKQLPLRLPFRSENKCSYCVDSCDWWQQPYKTSCSVRNACEKTSLWMEVTMQDAQNCLLPVIVAYLV